MTENRNDRLAAELGEQTSAHEVWRREHGVSTHAPDDPQELARRAVDELEERRLRLEGQLRAWPSPSHDPRGRRRLEKRIEALDVEIDKHWGVAYPSIVGNPFYGSGGSDPDWQPCRYCLNRIDRRQAYSVGMCADCVRDYEERTGKPPPRVPPLRSN